jgi:hypothetical protein
MTEITDQVVVLYHICTAPSCFRVLTAGHPQVPITARPNLSTVTGHAADLAATANGQYGKRTAVVQELSWVKWFWINRRAAHRDSCTPAIMYVARITMCSAGSFSGNSPRSAQESLCFFNSRQSYSADHPCHHEEKSTAIKETVPVLVLFWI